MSRLVNVFIFGYDIRWIINIIIQLRRHKKPRLRQQSREVVFWFKLFAYSLIHLIYVIYITLYNPFNQGVEFIQFIDSNSVQ